MLDDPRGMARASLICGVIAIVLLLLSYSWIPIGILKPELGDQLWQASFFGMSEVLGLCASVIGIILSIGVLARTPRRTPLSRRGMQGLVLGIVGLLLLIIPNLVATMLGL